MSSQAPQQRRDSPSPSGLRDRERRPLSAGERLTCIGAGVILVSLLLPWYGAGFSGLSQSGFDAFGFGAAALVVTGGGAVILAVLEAGGRPPPRPFRSAELIVLAGAWAALLGAFLVFDRPDELAGSTDVSPQIGVFAAIAGGLVIAMGGLRMRAERR